MSTSFQNSVVAMALLWAGLADRSVGQELVSPSAIQRSADSDTDFKLLTMEYLRARSPGNRSFNLQQLQRYYWNNPEFTSNGLPQQKMDLQGWDKYRDEFLKEMANFSQLTLLPDGSNFKITRTGEKICTQITFRQVGRLADGGRMDQSAKLQLDWIKLGGRWVIQRERKIDAADGVVSAL